MEEKQTFARVCLLLIIFIFIFIVIIMIIFMWFRMTQHNSNDDVRKAQWFDSHLQLNFHLLEWGESTAHPSFREQESSSFVALRRTLLCMQNPFNIREIYPRNHELFIRNYEIWSHGEEEPGHHSVCRQSFRVLQIRFGCYAESIQLTILYSTYIKFKRINFLQKCHINTQSGKYLKWIFYPIF